MADANPADGQNVNDIKSAFQTLHGLAPPQGIAHLNGRGVRIRLERDTSPPHTVVESADTSTARLGDAIRYTSILDHLKRPCLSVI